MLFGVGVSCRVLYSIVSYLYVSCSGWGRESLLSFTWFKHTWFKHIFSNKFSINIHTVLFINFGIQKEAVWLIRLYESVSLET